MVVRCGRGVLLCGAAVLGASGIAGASERSQLLVARAQSAYHARDYARAEALFAEAAAAAGDRDDAAFLFVAGGHFDLLRSERLLLRLDYDFYQTLHPDLDDFDFRSHRVAGLASWAVRRWLRASVQGGYDHYTLGSHAYLHEPFVLPFPS